MGEFKMVRNRLQVKKKGGGGEDNTGRKYTVMNSTRPT